RVEPVVGQNRLRSYHPLLAVYRHDPDRSQVWSWLYRQHTATHPYGRAATYAYNASQQIISAVNAAGFTTQYGYSGSLLTSITDARGFVTTIQWTNTAPARVTQVTAPDGKATTYAYTLDGSGNVTSVNVTDSNLKATNYTVS